MSLLQEINANYKAGLPVLAQLEQMPNEKLLETLKAKLSGGEYPLVDEILANGIVEHSDGEIAIHLVENQFPFILVDACAVYLCEKGRQQQIRFTARIETAA